MRKLYAAPCLALMLALATGLAAQEAQETQEAQEAEQPAGEVTEAGTAVVEETADAEPTEGDAAAAAEAAEDPTGSEEEAGTAPAAVVDDADDADDAAGAGAGVVEHTVSEGKRAVESTRSAVADSGSGLVEGGKSLWSAVLGTLERVGPMLLPLAIAVVILLVAWLVASFLGGWVTRALRSTDWDNRLADKTGIDEVSGGDIEGIAGTVVKWVVLLAGFVAVFNYLDLGMVAGPIENVLTQLGSAVLSLAHAIVILLIFWALALAVRFLSSRGLRAVGFDNWAARYIPERVVEGERVGASAQIGRLLFYVILVLAVPFFLEALGQEALLQPMNEMFGKVFAFVPNLFGALIILFFAKWAATYVREAVSNLLALTGLDRFAQKWGFGKDTQTPSQIVGAAMYFFILILALITAVEILGIEAVSGPVQATLQQLLSAVPLVLVAIIVVGIGYYVAKTVRQLVEGFLEGVGFDGLPEKLGLGFLKPREGHASLSAIVGAVVMGVILLLTVEQALATVELHELADLVGSILAYLPSLLIGLAIIVAGLSIGAYVGRLVGDLLSSHPQGKLVSMIANYFIVFLTFSMGLTQMGVGEEVVQVAVSAVLGGVALALALAFGLGGKDQAREFLNRHWPRE